MYIPETDNGANGLLAVFTAWPAYIYALVEPSNLTVAASFILPICFFVIGKTVDVLIRIYFDRKK